jgi:hypothetical protein
MSMPPIVAVEAGKSFTTNSRPYWRSEQFYWLRFSLALIAIAVLMYFFVVSPRGRFGGSLTGYLLGTVATLLIFWLTYFGYRKRRYIPQQANLSAWTSAHVYLGLAASVIATLHTGFSFGWNIHTLAYALLCLVVLSGIFGVVCYAWFPRLMAANRGDLTIDSMIDKIKIIDDELRVKALPLPDNLAASVVASVDRTKIGGSVREQIVGDCARCPTFKALAALNEHHATVLAEAEDPVRVVRQLVDEKATLLATVRRDIRYRAILGIWLYLHVPLSVTLIAALVAHIAAVFYLGGLATLRAAA